MNRRNRTNQIKFVVTIGITLILLFLVVSVTIYLLKKIGTGKRDDDQVTWYATPTITLRTSYWYSDDDYDVTYSTRSWYRWTSTRELNDDDDLDDLLDDWTITTRTTTTTTTRLTTPLSTTPSTPFAPNDYFFYGLNHSTMINATGQFYGSFGPYNISTNFTVYNQSYKSFNIHTNGYVQFTIDAYKYISISPFYSTIDTSKKATIYHGEIEDEQMLESISADIRRLCKFEEFNATWAYVVTWYEMRPYYSFYRYNYYRNRNDYSNYNFTNTFQLLMTSNGNESYAMFNFIRMDWPNDYVSNYFSSYYYFYYYDYDYYNTHYFQKIFENKSVRNLTDKTNMDRVGRWFINFNNTNCNFS